MNRPVNLAALKQKIRNLENNQFGEVQRHNLMALVVLSQMIPQGAIKGGSAMAIRYGMGARNTKDFDVARQSAEEQFLEELAENLETGWQGFTGRLKPRTKPKPVGVPEGYVMVPFDVKLDYEGKAWKTVLLELVHSELGSGDSDDYWMSNELAGLFTELGFVAPAAVRVMKVEHQIAQKIYAATLPGSMRAHDLVDLQVMLSRENVNLAETRRLCESTFSYRGNHVWPARFVAYSGWEAIYQEAVDGLELPGVTVRNLADALDWGNDLIDRIVNCDS